MVERAAVNRDVVGSSPTSGAIFVEENADSEFRCTKFAQKKAPHSDKRVIFPVKLKHRDQKATIYRPAKNFAFYRVVLKIAGKRRMLTFASYGEARKVAETKLKELHKGQQAAGLTAREASDTLTVRAMLAGHRQATGVCISTPEAVGGYLEAAKILPKGSTILEAVRAFSATLGTVKAKAIAEAVREFIESRKQAPKSGERARLSPVYARNVAAWLAGFSQTFPGHLVSDLGPDFVETHLSKFASLSAKARNDRRMAIGQWLRWCGRKEFIAAPALAKLLTCDAIKNEILPDAEIEFYTPGELRKILDATRDPKNEAANAASRDALRAVTALQAFGGARLEEALRLQWQDLFRTEGHVEISGKLAKTRKRRLLVVGPALLAWLADCKSKTGPIWSQPLNSFITGFARLRESVGVPSKRNGLRHGFISFAYILRGEVETSALAGTSPTILHSNYRGLAKRAEAEAWFAVKPAPAADAEKILIESLP